VGTVDATWTAMLLISALVYFNIMSVFFFWFGVEFIKPNPEIIGAGLGILIGVVNYLIFFLHGTHNRIIDKFHNESKNQKYIGAISSIIYVVLTIFLAHI